MPQSIHRLRKHITESHMIPKMYECYKCGKIEQMKNRQMPNGWTADCRGFVCYECNLRVRKK